MSSPLITPEQVAFLKENGYVAIERLISDEEVERYKQLYDRFLSGRIQTGRLRGDLGRKGQRVREDVENVTQISWPSYCVPVLVDAPLHRRAVEISRIALGDDMIFDFDMLIDKAPFTNTPTAWHQDAAYWPDQPDTRAISVWVALDEATIDNGCLWFVPGSHSADPAPAHRQRRYDRAARRRPLPPQTRRRHAPPRPHPPLQPRQHDGLAPARGHRQHASEGDGGV
jgi:phytanoyl-CoA hydroxylase